ncbi:keratin 99 [Chanos chanos]|uniref:Keratin 99 n=1 Tax=Chanos chanos TaxID=29144 RepID=A0A6J2V9Q1_CHACN|nr:keratin, type I cytoskeletal 42-like [Chanos chanos]
MAFSSQSGAGLSTLSLTGGTAPIVAGNSAMSLSLGSKYGGAGGYGTCISNSFSTSNFALPGAEFSLHANEKVMMQNLNDRLASYLERVRSLESANQKLELQIKEFYETRAPVHGKDLSVFHSTIADLRKQIMARILENAQISLKVDNAKLAASDFQMKYETEKNQRLAAEADLTGLKGVLNEINVACGDLEIQVTGLKDELLLLKKNREEDMLMVKEQQSGSVNVEMDCVSSVDLSKVLQEMREQYETLVQKNRREAEQWFQSKVEVLQSQMTTSSTEIKTSQTELTDLKRTFQNLEIELQALLKQKQCLEQSLAEVDGRYGMKLSELQLLIDRLQGELQQVKSSMQQQATEYQLLLDIKMRLEMEIAEYRRLLDGEWSATHTSKTVTETVSQTEEVEEEDEYNPHIQRRVKVIVEELVDGKVVSTSVDEKIQEVSG